MLRYRYFFATKADLLSVLDAVEVVLPLTYVAVCNDHEPSKVRYHSGRDLPKLCQIDSSNSPFGESYVVVQRPGDVTVIKEGSWYGRKRYLVDQGANPFSITLDTGGLASDDMLVRGRVATLWDSPEAQAIMKQFNKQIGKAFRRINAYWVGPEAEVLLDSGKRLALSTTSSQPYDLRRVTER